MVGWLCRVQVDDDHLGLSRGELVRIEPGAPRPVIVVWPSFRELPQNYGYLGGLSGSGKLTLLLGVGAPTRFSTRARRARTRAKGLVNHPHRVVDREAFPILQVVGELHRE